MTGAGAPWWSHKTSFPSRSRFGKVGNHSVVPTTHAQTLPATALPTMAQDGSSDSRPARPEASLRILLVDDDQAMIGLLAVVFSTEGYQVTTVTTAQDALAALATTEHDLVLADEQVLRHGGSALCERLLTKGMPVVVLDPADAQHPAFPGATGVATPPDVELLLALVAHLLAHRDSRKTGPA